MNAPEASDRIQHIHSWYFEAAQIKRAMLAGIGMLQHKIGKLNLDVQTDPMTGLHNRRGLALALEIWQAELRPFAVVALDIDHFKRVNDSYGHAAGDQVIIQLAQLMRSCSRDADVLCRSGGEEFLMLLPNAGPAAALKIAERLRQRVEHTDMSGVGHITISLGVAQWPLDAGTMDQVLEIADAALYKAKQSGRNRVVVAQELAA
jgi:diguanylate cyclase (GGDEF)-like protein